MDKPIRQYVYVDCWLGTYNILDERKKQAQFVFRNLPSGIRRSYIVNENYKDEIDYLNLTALEVAQELKKIIDRYIYSSNKEEIAKLIIWLEENEEQQYKKYLEYRIREADFYIEKYTKQRTEALGSLEIENF
jgi:hypothetical protein